MAKEPQSGDCGNLYPDEEDCFVGLMLSLQ
jgi:hypothetical protein